MTHSSYVTRNQSLITTPPAHLTSGIPPQVGILDAKHITVNVTSFYETELAPTCSAPQLETELSGCMWTHLGLNPTFVSDGVSHSRRILSTTGFDEQE